jgi:hypothetical protein
VTRASLREYAAVQRPRYQQATRAEKRRLLDEVVAVTGIHRKAAIRLLRRAPRPRPSPGSGGRPRTYGPEVAAAAAILWRASGRIGAHRLHPFVPDLVDRLARCGELTLSADVEKRLRHASRPTLARLLAPARALFPRRSATIPRPGNWLRQEIPVRTFTEWDEARPGFCEVDLVAHCGTSTEGCYLCTLCTVDIATTWVELEAVWGKTQKRVGGAIHHVWERFPVPLVGIDSDNVLSARRWSGAETQHPSGGSGSRCPVRPRRMQAAQWSSASEKDPAAHSEHRVRARAEPALTVLNTA